MVMQPHLTRVTREGVTLLEGQGLPGGVTLAFTERTGGVSAAPFASLNLGSNCGDDPQAVGENRLRTLNALGVAHLAPRLVNPRQVHSDEVVCVRDASDEAVRAAQDAACAGADAVVCSVPDVPVLLCFADCVPVVLAAPGAFAVAHAGWRGTEARIVAKALRVLCDQAGCAAGDVCAYVGPHIGVDDYEVSSEMAVRFAEAFGSGAVHGERNLDLGFCVRETLAAAGVPGQQICDECPSTAQTTDRFYSYRAEDGRCGRHGAVAVMAGSIREGGACA